MIRALLDTDVILDLLLDRTGFTDAGVALWQANKQGRIEGYIFALTRVPPSQFMRRLTFSRNSQLSNETLEADKGEAFRLAQRVTHQGRSGLGSRKYLRAV